MSYSFQFGPVFAAWPLLLEGTWKTIELSFLAMLGGLAVAIVCAWAKTGGPAPLRWLVNAYIELIRNTPFLVQLFFFFFALPAIGLRWSAHTAALTAMVVNLGAYATEIIRAGVEATPRGQIEAAVSLALDKVQVFTRVILPPALKKVWPAMVSQIIIVMLGSAVCGQISTPELSYAANLIQSRNFRAFESFIVATLIYLALAMLLRRLLNWAGPRFIFGS
jgi:polar amino acid transport system permease protein